MAVGIDRCWRSTSPEEGACSECASPAPPASSAATSSTGCSAAGLEVAGYDNLSTGQTEFLEPARQSAALPPRRGRPARRDDADRARWRAAISSSTSRPTPTSASARSIRAGPRAEHDRHLQRARGDARERRRGGSRSPRPARSTASPTSSRRRRRRRFPIQTSLYGASKLAGEGLIGAYAHGFGFQAYIFRFVSILGERYTHGHVFDFYQQAARRPDADRGARQRPAAQELPLRPGLRRRDADRRSSKAERPGQRLQPRHRRVLRGQRLARLDLRGARRAAGARTTPAASAAGSATARSSSSTPHASTRLGWAPRLTIREGVLQTLGVPAGEPVGAGASRMSRTSRQRSPCASPSPACGTSARDRGLPRVARAFRRVGLRPRRRVVDGLARGRAAALRAGPGRAGARRARERARCASPATRRRSAGAESSGSPGTRRSTTTTRRRGRSSSQRRGRRSSRICATARSCWSRRRCRSAPRARLEEAFARARPEGHASFACTPENLRLGKAIEVFTRRSAWSLGVRADRDADRSATLLAPFTAHVEWMRVESAEMTKHALNAFLATSVAFINELARLRERVGADAREVERGLKSEARIGPARLRPAGRRVRRRHAGARRRAILIERGAAHRATDAAASRRARRATTVIRAGRYDSSCAAGRLAPGTIDRRARA